MSVGKAKLKKPGWLKIRVAPGQKLQQIKGIMRSKTLHTVCEEAHCPNMQECWSGGTATFMIMGDTCTRACRFCNVKTGRPDALKPLDQDEPQKLVKATQEMNLSYVVVTSVNRDELQDEGASHFADCIRALRRSDPRLKVEVLTPDFHGRQELIQSIVDAKPHVFAHNIETVERLQKRVRDNRASYEQSLAVLRVAKEIRPEIYTKSSIMLGLGETDKEVLQAMDDLRAAGCDLLTLGQYLRPSDWHLAVEAYVTPEKFDWFRERALEKGFLYCASGPFVRSSYRAGEHFVKDVLLKA